MTWDGSTSSDFEVGSNWSTDSIPTNDTTTDTVKFTSVPSTMPSLSTNRSIYAMDFSVGGVTVNGNYDLTFGIDGIDSSGSGTNTINFNPLLSGTWQQWAIGSNNTLQVNGNLKGTASSLTLYSQTGGTVNFSGSNNTYNSVLNLRGNNNNSITSTITGAMDSLTAVKVSDKSNSTSNGIATLNLTGANASMETSSFFYVGSDYVGTMNVNSGADVTVGNNTRVGANTGSNGTLNISGSGTTWTQNGGQLVVGFNGTGAMTLSDSAVVNTPTKQTMVGREANSTGTLNIQSGGTYNADRINIGNQNGATGFATVTGAGSTMTADNKLNVGNGGTGTLTISAGGDVVSEDQMYIATNSSANGTVKVTGSGSTLDVQHNFKVGTSGTGSLTIEDSAVVDVIASRTLSVGTNGGSNGSLLVQSGGVLNAGQIKIGSIANGTGVMTVTGSGSTVNSSNRIFVGLNGGGSTQSELHIDNNAVVNDTSGSGFYLYTGGVLDFDGGTLNVTNSFQTANGSVIKGNGTLAESFYLSGVSFDGSAGQTLELSGVITNGGSGYTLTKNGAGTLKLTNDNPFSRVVNINAGTILIEHEDALGESSNNNANTTTNVASGATLALNKSSAMTVYENLVINGTGYGSTGAIDVVDGSHTISGTVSLVGNSTIDVSSSDDTLSLSGVVSGSNALSKSGVGALTLSGNNTYSGNTTVNQGTLNLTGSIDGNLLVAGGTVTGGTNANAVAEALTFSSGTISPNTTGTRGVFNIKGSGSSSWTGGTYVWDVSGGMGSSGNDADSNGYYEASGASDGSLYDILAFTGALDFSGGSNNSITIDIESYGNYTGYNWDTPTEIKIATAASISNFNESYFNIDATGFNDATGAWWLDWGIKSHGNALWLTYRAVPETSTWILILSLPLLVLLKFFYRRRKKLLGEAKGKLNES